MEYMFLYKNNIEVIEPGAFHGLDAIYMLLMQHNALTSLRRGVFAGLQSLKTIGLESNRIDSIEVGAFEHLDNLTYLNLESNLISSVSPGMFTALQRLESLHLGLNKIASIRNSTFIHLESLNYLDLYGNPLVLITDYAFLGLMNLETLIISEVKLMTVEEKMADGVPNLLQLTADEPSLCCLFKPADTCNTPPNPFATCEGMLRNTLLRVCLWILGLGALVGNLLVLAWRISERNTDRKHKAQVILISQLAISDLLMGVYMIFIGGADSYYGKDYFLHSSEWRESFACKLAGFVAMTSSEASVFLLVLISLDRFICIVFPFGAFHFRTKSTRVAVAVAWITAVALSIVPIIVSRRVSGFYGYSDVCIGLPLVTPATGYQGVWTVSDDGLTEVLSFVPTGRSGWAYSTAIFIVLNMICFLIILVCYVAIFVSARKASSSSGRKTERRDEIKMAAKMAIIVGTDFCCWMPIIIMGIVSQTGAAVVPVKMYVWTIIFILPINSFLNPYLYTISTIVQQRLKESTSSQITGTHRLSNTSRDGTASSGSGYTSLTRKSPKSSTDA
ncbi:G-protein coupled receptor GRL101-like [Diadema antillarum]|uniref:G-protein coupled receptor GRL101-like n=1 Tax=Diadema antillarum TaxID=105358 RepID=UPI003A8A944A